MVASPLSLVVVLGAFTTQQSSLSVLRVSPGRTAETHDTVLVTFDRPVAPNLAASLDPRRVFRIEPEVAGRLEWRDPVTIRFIPALGLDAGATYRVSLAANFRAADGTRLDGPYRFSFRVLGPRVLDAWPVNQWNKPRHLDPRSRFLLLVSGPADPEVAGSVVYLAFDPDCGPRRVRLRVAAQRRPSPGDPFRGRQPGARDTRRVVELVPASPLPSGCAGRLGVPERIDDDATAQGWEFHTFGPPRLVAVGCGGPRDPGGYEYADPGELPQTGRVGDRCATGPLALYFSTPVRGGEVLRRVRVTPAVAFTVHDTSAESDRWTLEGSFAPRTRYVVAVDSGLTDVFGQRLPAPATHSFTTPAFSPAIRYAYGRMVVERNGPHTLGVQHVNVDTLELVVAAVPDSLEAEVLARPWGLGEFWPRLEPRATTTKVAVTGSVDIPRITALKLPVFNAARPGNPTLLAVRVQSPVATATEGQRPIALVQVTDLAIHARVGVEEAAVWVTGVGDGLPRAGVEVALHDSRGRLRATARTDARGLARLSEFRPDTAAAERDCDECFERGPAGFVSARLGSDRSVLGVSDYDYDLSPWQFNVSGEWGRGREPRAAAVFTERGIYRPGEPVYAKAIVRDGPLGDLRSPPAGDSLRWVFQDREDGVLRDTTVALSAYGTADAALALGPNVPLGFYRVDARRRIGGSWRTVSTARYRVAEYRPPEFLVDVAGDAEPRVAGQTFSATVEARYLFGAPMARAATSWHARLVTVSPWQLDIPGTEGFEVGETGWWWEDSWWRPAPVQVVASGSDTLDGNGRLAVRVELPPPPKGRPARLTLEATVTDVNRQEVSGRTDVLVHPADFYVAARARGTDYFWRAGVARTLDVIATRPDGRREPGIRVRGVLVRREWHRVRRERGGMVDEVGEWVSDTTAACDVTTQPEPAACTLTPGQAGSYFVRFTARDGGGRDALTSFYIWVTGPGWVPWNDENRFKMEVVPDKTRYAVGDTATILFAAPFTDAEAWVTVEREGVILERRLRITSGTTTLELPITEAYVPNAFVSIVLARGRSAPPGPPDDPGRPTLRVGYAELRVTPGVKQLALEVQPLRAEYRPGDTAVVRIAVRDAGGTGRQSEVTLWAVDEGVLALTGYRTPDPVDLLYQPRGLGMRLGSSLTTVAAQMVEGDKGREPGGGGGLDAEGILRSRFQTTAFFLGSVVTDAGGNAVARAKLPDNLTTFRLMAVAVTRGDRYGSGQSELLVTRPLIARPAVPRFVREDDAYYAGVVVNHRLGGTPTVRVQARAQGLTLVDARERTAVLEAGRGREVRFAFRGLPGDTAVYRFAVSSGAEADAVETRVPVRPAFHTRAFTVAGLLHDTATVEFVLPDPVDAGRSQLELSFGTSPLAMIRGYRRHLRIYPYYCSEQISSMALPLIALHRAQQATGGPPLVRGDAAREIQTAVDVLSRRQREDGGIGLWSSADWTTPWLSAHAGRVLLAAREAGAVVSDSVLERLARYLGGYARSPEQLLIPVAAWYRDERYLLTERLAAADFLSRYGRPDVPVENSLLGQAARMAWEDRVWLAEVVARRRQLDAARVLLDPVWRTVQVEGRHAVIPDSAETRFYFWSTARPLARLLSATMAVDPRNALVGPLVETLVERGRARRFGWWSTQDYAATVYALLAYDAVRRSAAGRVVRVAAGGRVVLQGAAGGVGKDTSVALTGLVGDARSVRLALDAPNAGPPVFYFLTVREVPATRPVKPTDAGIAVQRWYERFDSAGAPIVAAREGDLVRVRLRITVPAERHFVVVDDALPAGLEAVDLSLRTAGTLARDHVPPGGEQSVYGRWDSGYWTPFEYRELRDDRVVYFATVLWPGTYNVTYVARATSPGVFIRPPAHAEEMYNPAVHGRSDGGVFTVSTGTP